MNVAAPQVCSLQLAVQDDPKGQIALMPLQAPRSLHSRVHSPVNSAFSQELRPLQTAVQGKPYGMVSLRF